MASEPTTVSREALQAWMLKVLQRKGMFAADAELVAARLIEAEDRGRGDYGLALLADIVNAMDMGDIDPRARTLTVLDLPASAILDGSTGAGQVGATRAMQAAIHKAQTAGVGLVIVKNSQPCGDVRLYAELAAQSGCIGFCTTNMGKATLPTGDVPVFGEHPQAWAVPAGDAVLVSLQMLTASEHQGLAQVAERGLLSLALTAGLTGGRTPSQKKKASPYGAGAEHFCLAIHADVLQAGEALSPVVTDTWRRLSSTAAGWEAVEKRPVAGQLALSPMAQTSLEEVGQSVRIPWTTTISG